MHRAEIRKRFSTPSNVVLPVIHVLDEDQTLRNIEAAKAGGCPGVFLINHDFPYPQLLPIIRIARQAFPDYWIGANFLAVTGKDAFPVLAGMQEEGVQVDGYWADDARIDERRTEGDQPEAEEIDQVRAECGWNGLYFGGTAFKKQREVDPEDYAKAAKTACNHMDVVTTSGIATGHSADLSKIDTFREACGETAIGIASGITPENISDYAPLIDCILVATGINFDGDFYNINPERLAALMDNISKGESQ